MKGAKDEMHVKSQAYAAVKFADACLRGLRGDAGVVECAFVASQVSCSTCHI